MNSDDSWALNALMDPWCLVHLDDGADSLFGFAVEHAGTGGLSWVLSTPVVRLDEAAGRARTLSGRRYSLGRRIGVGDLPNDEARIAFALLTAPYIAEPDLAPVVIGNLDAAAAWVTACKVARHLKVEPPPLNDPAAVRDFLGANLQPYARLRGLRSPC